MVNLQPGFPSSHFFLRRRHVKHPVFDLPFATLLRLGVGDGCIFLGRPLPRFCASTLLFPSEFSDSSDLLTSEMPSMVSWSISSTFGTTPGLPPPSESSVSPSVVTLVSEPIVVAEKDELLEHSTGDEILVSTWSENQACGNRVLLLSLNCNFPGICPEKMRSALRRLHGDDAGGDAARVEEPVMDEASGAAEIVGTCRRSAGKASSRIWARR